jgi:hypothetical protein
VSSKAEVVFETGADVGQGGLLGAVMAKMMGVFPA